MRLGFNGSNEIRNHPFFNNIDWDLIAAKEVKPPFKPRVMGESDISNIDRVFTREPP